MLNTLTVGFTLKYIKPYLLEQYPAAGVIKTEL
jgi:hypothetical protein